MTPKWKKDITEQRRGKSTDSKLFSLFEKVDKVRGRSGRKRKRGRDPKRHFALESYMFGTGDKLVALIKHSKWLDIKRRVLGKESIPIFNLVVLSLVEKSISQLGKEEPIPVLFPLQIETAVRGFFWVLMRYLH